MTRLPRCLRLVVDDTGKNQCTAERTPGSDLCMAHLSEAAHDFKAILRSFTSGNHANQKESQEQADA